MAILTLGSCSGSKEKKADSDDTANVIENVADIPAVISIKAGEQIPPADGKLIVLDFNATWCPPCRQFAPNFDKVAEKYRGKASFYSVDVDQNPELAAQFNVQSIPTVVYIRPDGTSTSTLGYMEADEFDGKVMEALNK